jgi:hypothetical protein
MTVLAGEGEASPSLKGMQFGGCMADARELEEGEAAAAAGGGGVWTRVWVCVG